VDVLFYATLVVLAVGDESLGIEKRCFLARNCLGGVYLETHQLFDGWSFSEFTALDAQSRFGLVQLANFKQIVVLPDGLVNFILMLDCLDQVFPRVDLTELGNRKRHHVGKSPFSHPEQSI
jgi:hypothetical protein